MAVSLMGFDNIDNHNIIVIVTFLKSCGITFKVCTEKNMTNFTMTIFWEV